MMISMAFWKGKKVSEKEWDRLPKETANVREKAIDVSHKKVQQEVFELNQKEIVCPIKNLIFTEAKKKICIKHQCEYWEAPSIKNVMSPIDPLYTYFLSGGCNIRGEI